MLQLLTDDAFPGLHHGSESLIYTGIRKQSYTEWKIQNQCPHLIQLCTCNRWQNRNIPAVPCWDSCHPKVPLQQIKPWQIRATPCAAQQLLAEHRTAQLFYKEVPELPPLIPGLCFSLFFPRKHLMQILKNLSTPKGYRGIKHGVVNISLDFCKTHQSHNDSEFWGTLKTMLGTIWKESC